MAHLNEGWQPISQELVVHYIKKVGQSSPGENAESRLNVEA